MENYHLQQFYFHFKAFKTFGTFLHFRKAYLSAYDYYYWTDLVLHDHNINIHCMEKFKITQKTLAYLLTIDGATSMNMKLKILNWCDEFLKSVQKQYDISKRTI